jgi:hypothetical protein
MFLEVSQDALVLLRAMKGHHDEHNNPARPLSKGYVHEAGVLSAYPLLQSMLDFVKKLQDAGAHDD